METFINQVFFTYYMIQGIAGGYFNAASVYYFADPTTYVRPEVAMASALQVAESQLSKARIDSEAARQLKKDANRPKPLPIEALLAPAKHRPVGTLLDLVA